MSIDKLAVGEMSIGEMSVGEMSWIRSDILRGNGCHCEVDDTVFSASECKQITHSIKTLKWFLSKHR